MDTATPICANDAAEMASTPSASNTERMEKNNTHCTSFCPVILRLPDLAFPLRAARIERRDFRTKLASRPSVPVGIVLPR